MPGHFSSIVGWAGFFSRIILPYQQMQSEWVFCFHIFMTFHQFHLNVVQAYCRLLKGLSLI